MNKSNNPDIMVENKSALLAALTRARGDFSPLQDTSDELDSEENCYYTLSKEQVEALVSGNMEKIENWVSNLDQRQATCLLRWLIKESV
jgi:hypothetical protein